MESSNLRNKIIKIVQLFLCSRKMLFWTKRHQSSPWLMTMTKQSYYISQSAKALNAVFIVITLPCHANNQRYFRKSFSNYNENCRKASRRCRASFGQNKTVGCQTRAKPPITKVTERTKSSNFRLFLRLWLCDVIHKWRNKWSDLKPELKRNNWYQFYFDSKSTMTASSSYVRSMTVVNKCSSSMFRTVENGEGLN